MSPDHINIRIGDYVYDLPEERIARYPLPERDSSKLLCWNGIEIKDMVFRELPDILSPDNLLVFNNTRVIRARLLFRKESGATIEIFCLEPLDPYDFAMNLSSTTGVVWKCLAGNAKRWKNERLTASFIADGVTRSLHAVKLSSEEGTFTVRFEWEGEQISFGEVLEAMGHMPIPPYLGRDDEQSDIISYQTVYARIEGSVAAPTAGLHFTPSLLKSLKERGFDTAEVTLHVSAGTFRPVKSEMISDHLMHREHFYVSQHILRGLIGRKVIAVGTTTVRTLESIYWLGVQCAKGNLKAGTIAAVSQWEPYSGQSDIDTDSAIRCLIGMMESAGTDTLEATTDIMIVPGYRFRIVNGMITNFHQPGSTLLLLVAAFTGNRWRELYDHALTSGYRFLSYGDSMLLEPAG
ncbi:MAG: S-adenosylmethionine:tRNA ribosyltransferase-isomerase [Bacteroidales bacterium]|jgi:S-adenosylmethionine:tRNA ribosyltransferase-isomerase|nr:S-adenosylmethionine:tRNA ribosyltransferase-isomerase [Bacteroidales bacterium]